MVLVDGRASVRNGAETFGLERELMEALGELDDAWRSCQTGEGSGLHHGRHREPRRSGGREPLRTTGPTATPLEVREGQAPHGRHSGPQAGRSRFPLRREEDVDLGWSPSSRPRSTWPDVGCAQGALPVARVVFDPRTVREARDGQRGVKAQVQPSPGSARGTLEEVEGHLRVEDPRSLLRRPDPGRPSDYGEVARPGT